MESFKPVVIIPCGENRLDNLVMVVDSLLKGEKHPEAIVIVCDGFDRQLAVDALLVLDFTNEVRIEVIQCPKHVGGSGTRQPKNFGADFVNEMVENGIWVTHLWFVDSDIIMDPFALKAYEYATNYDYGEPRVMIGPYEWLPTGIRRLAPEIKNDTRWAMFEESGHRTTHVGKINVALANFGGNVVYPLEAFNTVGGFWDDLSTGRVEDGEIGLAMCAAGIPMTTVSRARGYHLDHPVNHQWKIDTNEIEVPMLNAKHPWVENEGIFVADNDGKRFEWIDPETGEARNTVDMWRKN